MGTSFKLTAGRIAGACLGFFGTLALGLGLSFFLDSIYPDGPGPGSLAFMLSLLLAPIMGFGGAVLGGKLRQKKNRGKPLDAGDQFNQDMNFTRDIDRESMGKTQNSKHYKSH